MLLHFQYKPLYASEKIPGWTFTFFYKNVAYHGTYHGNGTIDWNQLPPSEQERQLLEKQIHELMVFHVYD